MIISDPAPMLPQSAPYHRSMRHFVVFIAVLLGLASVLGATTANAHRYVATPIVVLNHVDADNKPIPVVVQVQRGQIDLGAGLMLPCGSHPAIEVSAPQLTAPPPARSPVLAPCRVAPDWQSILPLRPPKSG
ncbi:hypothetical protein [Devosia sp. Naph2]|uniref:hypothetical protein n=1 Tax=Devosia polycyclovorans TaxID=3345148 RepID=UPI0035D0B3A3